MLVDILIYGLTLELLNRLFQPYMLFS